MEKNRRSLLNTLFNNADGVCGNPCASRNVGRKTFHAIGRLSMPSTNDAVTLLKADHRKVEALFEQFEKSKDNAGKQKLGSPIHRANAATSTPLTSVRLRRRRMRGQS